MCRLVSNLYINDLDNRVNYSDFVSGLFWYNDAAGLRAYIIIWPVWKHCGI